MTCIPRNTWEFGRKLLGGGDEETRGSSSLIHWFVNTTLYELFTSSVESSERCGCNS